MPLRLRWQASAAISTQNIAAFLYDPLVCASTTTATRSLFKSIKFKSIEIWAPFTEGVVNPVSLKIISSAAAVRAIQKTAYATRQNPGHITWSPGNGDPSGFWYNSDTSVTPFFVFLENLEIGTVIDIRYSVILADGNDSYSSTTSTGVLVAGQVYQVPLATNIVPYGRASI